MPAATRERSALRAARPRHGASQPTRARCRFSVEPVGGVRADECSPQLGRLCHRESDPCAGRDAPKWPWSPGP
eukprot:2592187-Alexandrium_andersonii.AAC.1